MDNQLEVFNNDELRLQVRTILNKDGSILVNAEDAAIGFGWSFTENKNGKEYTSIRWNTINGYCEDLGFCNKLQKDDFIPESLFYLLGMKASNKVAQEFQKWLAIEVIPSIRKTGSYQIKNEKSYKDRTLDLVAKAIDELPNDKNKNRLLLKILDTIDSVPIDKIPKVV